MNRGATRAPVPPQIQFSPMGFFLCLAGSLLCLGKFHGGSCPSCHSEPDSDSYLRPRRPVAPATLPFLFRRRCCCIIASVISRSFPLRGFSLVPIFALLRLARYGSAACSLRTRRADAVVSPFFFPNTRAAHRGPPARPVQLTNNQFFPEN